MGVIFVNPKSSFQVIYLTLFFPPEENILNYFLGVIPDLNVTKQDAGQRPSLVNSHPKEYIYILRILGDPGVGEGLIVVYIRTISCMSLYKSIVNPYHFSSVFFDREKSS